MLKLNGGLGTSMGMTKAKSLLEVKDGHTFLDVIARQILHLRERHGAGIPLLLMNSFATRDDTLAALERYPELKVDDLPLDFLQGKVPKLLADSFDPAEWPDDPALEWAPPGHGDVFASLAATGPARRAARARLRVPLPLELGQPGRDPRADASSVGWRPRACRSCPRSSTAPRADRKGGHLARRRSTTAACVLRETAQVPDEDQEAFEDISVHRYFNANNIWVSLASARREAPGGRRRARACR